MNTDTNKTVDVVMCTYNGSKYLREQLDSIVEQTYPIHRMIVQDDGSTDNTVAIVKEYAAKYSFIELYENEHNLGYNLNFKTAAMRATADFVALADQDDVWFKDKIARQVEAIGHCNICASAYTRSKTMDSQHKVSLPHTLKAQLFGSIPGHTMLLRREFVQQDEVWLPDFIYDWGLILSAHFTGKDALAWIDEPLNWHREHAEEAFAKRGLEEQKQHKQWLPSVLLPYVEGLAHYRQLQKRTLWRRLYTYAYDHTNSPEHRTEHRMAGYMLSIGLVPLLRLGIMCAKYRHEVYTNQAKTNGLMGLVRGFCFPLIYAYYVKAFDK